MSLTPVFDGHNDVLLRLALKKGDVDPVRAFIDGETTGQFDLPRAKRGGLAAGFFALFVPSPPAARNQPVAEGLPDVWDTGSVDRSKAQQFTLRMASILLRIEQQSEGQLTICRSTADLRHAMAHGSLAAIMHIEGAEAIDPEFEMLDVMYAAGLRSLGPVWSRSNIFGHGVPFRYPSSPDIGPGLTDAGKALVRECNRRRILVDLSHLNEKGFWDVAALSDAPLVATHSNVHAISAQSRNLTDKQLDAIAESKGLVGINFAVNFLRADGARNADTSLEDMLRHIDYLVAKLGEDGVALGSDFDGATMPAPIGDVAGVQALVEAMRSHGYGETMVEKLSYGNWLGVLDRIW